MKKLIAVFSLAGLATFGLFAFMASLINDDRVVVVDNYEEVPIDVYQTPEDSKHNEIERPKPVPPQPKEPIPRETLTADTAVASNEFSYQPAVLTIPSARADLSGMGGSPDREASPIVQVTPKYPMDAARNGTEGWVVLRFDINEIGEVINVKVLDSLPRRVFDSAAKKALKRWKYRPKSIDGKQVQQHNFTVQLDFKMDQQS